jgi:serine/threonine protein kinase
VSGDKQIFNRGEMIADKYEVLDHLDESPLGNHYRVKHTKTGKFIRLTMLNPAIANREKKEGIVAAYNIANKASHPNILRVGEVSQFQGVAFYTMEDFDGIRLRDLMQQYKAEGRRFTTQEAAQVAVQICEALLALDSHGVVLRGLRPENVLVNIKHVGPRLDRVVANIKLIGVGFSDLVPSAKFIEDEFSLGPAQYIAPELRGFEPHPTIRSDIYSNGVILYEMLTGTAPVGTFQLPSTIRSDIPKHLDDIIELALAHAPDDRYPCAADFRNDIQRLFEHGALTPDVYEPASRTPLLLLALAVAIISVIGGIFLSSPPDLEDEAEKATLVIRQQIMENQSANTTAQQMVLDVQAQANLPENMVYVPSGEFIQGRIHLDPYGSKSEPLAQIESVSAFAIDSFEYPNQPGTLPTVKVSQKQALRLCKDAGKRLCSAIEWEKACKGPLSYTYGYGDTFDAEFCGNGIESRGKAGVRAKCTNGFKVYDIAGNVREWVADNPPGKPNRGLVKGGLRHSPERGTRCAFSTDESAAFKDVSMGFRCCADIVAPPAQP